MIPLGFRVELFLQKLQLVLVWMKVTLDPVAHHDDAVVAVFFLVPNFAVGVGEVCRIVKAGGRVIAFEV